MVSHGIYTAEYPVYTTEYPRLARRYMGLGFARGAEEEDVAHEKKT